MKNSSKMLFMLTLLISTIMVISSTSWINMWIGLEINLMSFIPLISKSKNILLSKSMMTYFLIQSMASMLFITSILMNKYLFINSMKNWMNIIIIMSMMMKMGMAPFHMWFPEIMNKMNWAMCFILMTWQKIAPLYVLSMVIEKSKTVIMMIMLTSLVGAIGGINQTSTRKIMAYSSINHLSWLVTCTMMYSKSWMMYMMVYMLMMMLTSLMLYKYNILYVNQMNIFFKSKTDKLNLIFMMLSLGGLPPFLGFMPKWMAIQYMINMKEILLMTIMVMSALLTLSFYMRMSMSMNLTMNQSQKWMYMYFTDKKMSTYIFILNFMLPMFILLMNFY